MSKLLIIFIISTNYFFTQCHAGEDDSPVKSSSCSPNCGKNERSVKCPETLCIPQTCDEVGYNVPCPIVGPGGPCSKPAECICIDGYVRNNKGVCVPKKQCPSCGGDKNAIPGCGYRCGKHCDKAITAPIPCPCNYNGCVCKQGYVYDDNKKKCVRPNKCSKPKPNEVWSPIGEFGCQKHHCRQINQPDLCIDPIEPVGAYVCKQGYLRARNGTCIPREDCYADLCSKPNEYYESNPSCPERKCGVDDSLVDWDSGPVPIGPGACRCECDYYRNDKGDCVPWEDCSGCGGDENAQPGCGVNCGKQCSDVLNPNPVCILVCNLNGCDCKDGYYYDSIKKKCVKAKECTSICPADEELSECPNRSNNPQTCNEVGYPKPINTSSVKCKPACVCKDGKVRNKDGKCVPPSQCPGCGGDENAQPGCGVNCGKKCSDVINPNPICILICYLNGCDCKDNYFYDSNKKKCVKAEDCPSVCPADEELSDCPNGSCYPLTCDELGYPKPNCGSSVQCKRGCVCKDGKVRNKDGKCVATSECPSCGGDPNAQSGCGGNCGKKCSDLNNPSRICPHVCRINSCDCKEDYYYDSNTQKCVKKEKCPSNSSQPITCSDDTLQLLQRGNALFTGKFLNVAYKKTPRKSLIMSPLSVFVPIAELALYAEDDTYTQLMNILNLRTKNDIRCVFPTLTRTLRDNQEVILKLPARFYFSDLYPIKQNFHNDMRNVFDADAQNLDFSDKQGSADIINAWVENNTNNRIKDIASPEMFDDDTRLVLANAIFFLGNWVTQFNPNETTNRPFHISSTKTINIPTMYQEDNFRYAESGTLNCKILEMPYKGGNFSFVVFLPNSVDGLSALVEKLQDPDVFYGAYDSTSYEKVMVYLPKIKTEAEYNLIEIMQKAGVTDLFDRYKSNLQNILEKYEPLYISAAKQKAFVQVDETGTEAAAANIFIGSTITSVGPTRPIYLFNADHPFAYYILRKRDIIFCGTFVDIDN
ncbi:unnamed protein product [Diatraea saccharalis]|uniref:Serpin domain-containing protein n=1 Tax=Diatraea saccharalis TaxID=40085 RepID=A0A9N9WCF8_9NEOP|nr:unnamed protein product [Diatraea saccharalis]